MARIAVVELPAVRTVVAGLVVEIAAVVLVRCYRPD